MPTAKREERLMTRTISRMLCDGEELVITGIHDPRPEVEGDPRESGILRRGEALSEDPPRAGRVVGVAPARRPAQEAQ
jgi:hypothetical protein